MASVNVSVLRELDKQLTDVWEYISAPLDAMFCQARHVCVDRVDLPIEVFLEVVKCREVGWQVQAKVIRSDFECFRVQRGVEA